MSAGATTGALLLLIVVVLGILFFLRREAQARMRRARAEAYPSYVEGLHLLLRGRKDEAARQFRAAIEGGAYVLEARLRLGDLLREKGAIDQATRLHQSILALPDIPEALHREATLALVEDYRASGKPEACIEVLQRSLGSLGSDEALLAKLLQVLEEVGRWDRAVEVARSLEEVTGRSVAHRVALYRVERAQEALASGNVRRARADLRKALVDDPKCGPARLVLGDAYVQEGELDKAVAEWTRLARESKDLASMAFARIERTLFDAGDYGRILEAYGAVLQDRPADVDTLCRLALHDERIGYLEKALERAQLAIEASPEEDFPHALAAAFLAQMGRADEAAARCRELAQRLEARARVYRCPHCGTRHAEFGWRCPSCRRIGWFASIRE